MPTTQQRGSSATCTPFPLQGITARMDAPDIDWMRTIREWLHRPSTIEGGDPKMLAAYCFDLLSRLLSTEAAKDSMDYLQRFSGVPRSPLACRTHEVIKEYLRPALMYAWCQETCVELLQDQWTLARPAVGQHIVTSLFVQECLDGHLLYGSIDDHGIHVWNQLPDKLKLDLTAEQFLLRPRMVMTPGVIDRQRLLERSGVRASYEVFRGRIIRSLIASGIAAASLVDVQKCAVSDLSWSEVG